MGDFIGKGTLSIFNLLGAIVILLWGVRMIRKGVEQALIPFANPSNPIFRNKFYALLSGTVGAASLQSSTALVLIVASVATKITIPLNIGLAFVLGADVGTAVATQLFSFNIKSMGPLLLFVGFIIQRSLKKEQPLQKLGQVSMGFGFVLYALSTISTIASQIQNSGTLSDLLSNVLINDVALALLISILLTWLSHSSLAIVLMTIELVGSDVLPIDLGLSLILGANIGACLPAYIDSLGQPVEARRLTFGNVIFRMTAGIIAIPFLKFFGSFANTTSLDSVRFLALAHLVFNCSAALLFIFLTTPISKIIMKILPNPKNVISNGVSTKFLHPDDIHNVDIAIMNLKKEMLRMSDNIYLMLDQSARALSTHAELAHISHTGKNTQSLYKSVTKFLRKVYESNLEDNQSFTAMLINSYCTDLSQIGDIMTNTLFESLETKHKRNIQISHKHKEILEYVWLQLKENLNLSQEVFRTQNKDLAQELISRKEMFKKTIIHESLKHKKLLLEGDHDEIAVNDIYLDLLNYLRRINAHITAVAYAIVENTMVELR